MLKTVFAVQPWQCCPAPVLLPCLAKCDSIHKPSTWWVNVMLLSDRCLSVEGAAQKLVGEVSGVVQLMIQSELSTWLLQSCKRSWLRPATVRYVSRACAMPEFDWSIALERQVCTQCFWFLFCICEYNENCFDGISLQDFILVALLAVQLNLMVLRLNTQFRLAPLRSVEQVSGLKNKT